MDEIFYTDCPIEFLVSGDVVVGTIKSGGKNITFAMSRSTFVRCCRKAGNLVQDLQAQGAKVIELKAGGAH